MFWGAWAVLFPSAIFHWLNMPQPNYPQFWQCFGMIVGVYGIGYAIAAFDPVRHWPIVLVGFLGKVFGPLGLVQALWTGELPWGFALNCVTNDLIWWVPFFLILKYVWDQYQSDADVPPLPVESTLLAETMTTQGSSLAQLSQQRPVLLVFCVTQAACSVAKHWQTWQWAALALRKTEPSSSWFTWAQRHPLPTSPRATASVMCQ